MKEQDVKSPKPEKCEYEMNSSEVKDNEEIEKNEQNKFPTNGQETGVENEKNEQNKFPTNGQDTGVKNENTTPKKNENNDKSDSTPIKAENSEKNTFKTPEKVILNCKLSEKFNSEKTPEKICDKNNLKIEENSELEMFSNYDGEEGMISTTEQARLLIAASKTPSKSTNRTPDKITTPSRRTHYLESSPVTPGKHKRAELITLSSPKTKKFKQF